MKFLASWSIQQDKWLPIIKKFSSMSAQEQQNAGDGATIVGRWHDVAGRRGMLVFDANSISAVQRYLGQWNAYCDIEITPVVEDEEATVLYRQIIADSGA